MMPDVLVRDVESEVVESLKKRAALNGRSLQSELKIILEQAAPSRVEDARKLAAKIRRDPKWEAFREHFFFQKASPCTHGPYIFFRSYHGLKVWDTLNSRSRNGAILNYYARLFAAMCSNREIDS